MGYFFSELNGIIAIFAGVLASSLHVMLHLITLIVAKYIKVKSFNRYYLYTTVVRLILTLIIVIKLGGYFKGFIAQFAIALTVSYGILSLTELFLIKNKLDRSFFRNA